MVRIKGANSDYRFNPKTQQIEELKPLPRPTHLDLYICPYDMPSPVEKPVENPAANEGHSGWCEGQDSHCPSDQGKAGHALVRLHQTNGIALTTDNDNQLIVDQSGRIILRPATGQVVLEKASGRDRTPLHIQSTATGWSLQLQNGPQIHVSDTGSIRLVPTASGKVEVDGALACKTLSVDGKTNSPLAEEVTALKKQMTALKTQYSALENRLNTIESAQ